MIAEPNEWDLTKREKKLLGKRAAPKEPFATQRKPSLGVGEPAKFEFDGREKGGTIVDGAVQMGLLKYNNEGREQQRVFIKMSKQRQGKQIT